MTRWLKVSRKVDDVLQSLFVIEIFVGIISVVSEPRRSIQSKGQALPIEAMFPDNSDAVISLCKLLRCENNLVTGKLLSLAGWHCGFACIVEKYWATLFVISVIHPVSIFEYSSILRVKVVNR